MASISKDKNGTKRIAYYDSEKKSVSIRLGKTTVKMAETIKCHVEKLLSAQAMGVSVESETARWLAEIPDQLHQKLAQKGFVPPRKVVGTLGEVIPEVIKEKSVDAKPATIEIWGQAERSLYKYFGKDRRIDTITTTEAREFCAWLAKKGSFKKSGPLKQATVAKRVQHALSFFLVMVERGDISSNPFSGLAKKADVDETRNHYISEETILKIMEYAPDAEWRLIIALWRFAGLRAASEILSLKWEDILWDQEAIMVHAPKTERYQGKAVRKIPFFPHLEECLMEAAEQAKEGSIYVVDKHAPLYLRGKKERTYISRQGNIGTSFKKIVLRAGFTPWDKLLINLRASFETDLLNGKYGHFGIHTIAYWLGHSVKVMLEHYARIQKSDYDKIALASQEIKKRKNQTNQMVGNKEAHLVPFPLPKTKASLNASLYTAARGVIGGNEAESATWDDSTQPLETTVLSGKKRNKGEPRGTPSKWTSGWRGIQATTLSPLKNKAQTDFAKPGVIKSVITCDTPEKPLENEQLSDLILAWPSLASNIREAILLLARR